MSAGARRVVLLAATVVAAAGCTSGGDRGSTTARAEGTTPAAGAPAGSAAPRQVRLLLLGRFNQPTYLTAPRGDKRRFVVEREGRIRVVRGGRVLGTPFLDVSDVDELPRPSCPCRRMRGLSDQGVADALITVPKHWPPVIVA